MKLLSSSIRKARFGINKESYPDKNVDLYRCQDISFLKRLLFTFKNGKIVSQNLTRALFGLELQGSLKEVCDLLS